MPALFQHWINLLGKEFTVWNAQREREVESGSVADTETPQQYCKRAIHVLMCWQKKRGCGIENKNYFKHLQNPNEASLGKFTFSVINIPIF